MLARDRRNDEHGDLAKDNPLTLILRNDDGEALHLGDVQRHPDFEVTVNKVPYFRRVGAHGTLFSEHGGVSDLQARVVEHVAVILRTHKITSVYLHKK